jgi:hypothetical protein
MTHPAFKHLPRDGIVQGVHPRAFPETKQKD